MIDSIEEQVLSAPGGITAFFVSLMTSLTSELKIPREKSLAVSVDRDIRVVVLIVLFALAIYHQGLLQFLTCLP